jgi:3-deoxy-7-phosphoheptulonate synthase
MGDESDLIIMAGPCSIESEDQLRRIAGSVKEAGGSYLRGGAFKPRTEAGQWTGHGEKALKWMRKIGDEFGLKIVTEIMDSRDIPIFGDNGVDEYQVGARNAQNQSLLLALGEAQVPVLLKNGMNTTLKEWLGSAGKAGNSDSVMLCARGKNNEIDVARNGQDITTLVKLVDDTPYRIIFDPSHITGKRELVYGVTMGAVAAGVDGIMVEVHYDPVMSKTDGRQSITPKQLKLLVRSAHEQRNLYLAQADAREGFAKTTIPRHVDIYFQSDKTVALQTLFDGLDFRHYEDDETTGILTARIPDGHLGKLREHGYAIGKVVKYSAKEDSFAEAVHIIMPHGEKIYMSPFSIDALGFRGKSETLKAPGRGERVELAHGFAGQTIRDAYLTLDMGRVPEPLQKTPLIIYKIMKE